MRSRSGLRLATKALIIRHKSLRDPVAGCRGLGDCVWVIAPDVAAARPPSLVFALASSPRTARSRLIRPPNTIPPPPPRRLHLFGARAEDGDLRGADAKRSTSGALSSRRGG